jgi:hypothetical protein
VGGDRDLEAVLDAVVRFLKTTFAPGSDVMVYAGKE